MIKLIIIGLILAAIVVGYMIFAQKFNASQQGKINNTTNIGVVTPTPAPTTGIEPTPEALFNQQSTDTKTLPGTGFPVGLLGIFATSLIISGFFLRKYPD